MGVEGGCLALQSLSTAIKAGPFNFQPNELFSTFLRQQMAISKFLLHAFPEMWWDFHPLITLNLKRGARSSDYHFNEPPPKFIRSFFP